MADRSHHKRTRSKMQSREKEQFVPTSQPCPTLDFNPTTDFELYDEPQIPQSQIQQQMPYVFEDSFMPDQFSPLFPTFNISNQTDPQFDITKTLSDETSSFFNISSPSGLGTSSFQHIRTYSDNSQRTGVSGSGSANTKGGYYTPGDLDSLAIEVDMQDEGDVMVMPHIQEHVLASMCTPTPQPVSNPYQKVTMSPIEGVVYQDMPDNFTYSSMNMNMNMTTPYSMSPQPEKIYSKDPWTPVHPQVPRYDPGYAMFLPSPGPAGEEAMDLVMSSESLTPKSVVDSSSTITEKPRSKTISKKPKTKGKCKETIPTLTWEHTVAAKNGLLHYSEDKKEVTRRSGVRSGKLEKAAADKALIIRRLKACWPCWVQKVPCSEGEVCDRCNKHLHAFSPETQLCSRSGFRDFEPTFFPDYLHEHLSKRDVEELCNRYTAGWTDIPITVAVSTGPMFKPMRLPTLVFIPGASELTTQTRLTTASEGQDSQIVMQYSAPIGLQGFSGAELKKTCEKHIDRMVIHPEYPTQSTAGNLTQLPHEILEIVRKHCEDTDSSLLRNVMKLHAIHFFMSSLPTFTEESAQEIRQMLQAPTAPTTHFSSRLLNRQIKYAMHKLHREKTLEVLEGLEKTIRSRTRDSWGTTFCAILVICLCIENLQIAADILVNIDMIKEGEYSKFNRQQSANACLSLEENPFNQFKKLFHDVYKSHKEAKGKDAGWNPLRLIDLGKKTGLDPTTDAMARSMYNLVRTNWTEVTKLASNPFMVNLGSIAEASSIKTNNSGRLAAKFLKSFFPDS